MIGEYLALLFLSRELAHRAHLKTTSYAQHVALKDFYGAVLDRTDALAEAYQGRHGVIEYVPVLALELGEDITEALARVLELIERHRNEALGEDATLQNMIDEVIGLFLATLYKLRTLQ